LGPEREGGIPWLSRRGGRLTVETKVLKQLVRDIIQPDRNLGHSDRKDKKADSEQTRNTSVNGSAEQKAVEPNIESGVDTLSQASQPCEDCEPTMKTPQVKV
jgi:hypothetical protein